MTDTVNQGASSRLTIVLKDYAGAVVSPSATDTLTLTIKDLATGTVLNSVEDLDIRAAVIANGGYVDPEPATNAMVSTDAMEETHVAIVKFTTPLGLAGSTEEQFTVRRLRG